MQPFACLSPPHLPPRWLSCSPTYLSSTPTLQAALLQVEETLRRPQTPSGPSLPAHSRLPTLSSALPTHAATAATRGFERLHFPPLGPPYASAVVPPWSLADLPPPWMGGGYDGGGFGGGGFAVGVAPYGIPRPAAQASVQRPLQTPPPLPGLPARAGVGPSPSRRQPVAAAEKASDATSQPHPRPSAGEQVQRRRQTPKEALAADALGQGSDRREVGGGRARDESAGQRASGIPRPGESRVGTSGVPARARSGPTSAGPPVRGGVAAKDVSKEPSAKRAVQFAPG